MIKSFSKFFCFSLLVLLSKTNTAQNNTSTVNSTEKLNFAVGLLQFYNVNEIPISVFDATDSFCVFDVDLGNKIDVEFLKISVSYKANGKLNTIKPIKGKISKKDLENLKKLPIGTTIYINDVIVKSSDQKMISLPNSSFKLTKWKVLN